VRESRARKQRPGEKLKAAVAWRTGCSSGRGLGQDRVSQRDVQRVIVLHQRRVLVVQDQVLEGGVEVVGFSEAVAGRRFVDHAVLGVTVHPARETREQRVSTGSRAGTGTAEHKRASPKQPEDTSGAGRRSRGRRRARGSPACQLPPPPASSIWREDGQSRAGASSVPPRALGGTHTTEQA